MFKEAIIKEQRRNQRLIDLSTASGGMEEIGNLVVERRGKGLYCYERRQKDGKKSGKRYLGKPESEAAQEHLGKRLKKEMILRLDHNQRVLQGLEKNYLDCGAEALMDGLPPEYRVLAEKAGVPEKALLFEQQYEEVKRWAAGDWERNRAPFPKSETYAKDGTRVRSKGEGMYYNLLQEHGVINVYDCYRLFRKENGEKKVICPDFQIRCLDGTLIIIEHFGMLNDLQYSINAGTKLHWYTMCGFVLGRNLFVTGDDRNGGTDSHAILEVVEKVERLFYGY